MAANSTSQKPIYSLPLTIDTGANKVTAVQIELLYDPEVLTHVTISPGRFFTHPLTLLNEMNSTTGRISQAVGINFQSEAVRGQGVVATINFQSKVTDPTTTTIAFLSKTLVTATGVSKSVLKSTIPAEFIVGKNVTYTQ